RTLNVYELGQPLPPDCDLIETGANRYAVYRSVPVVSAKEDLEIHRFEFVWDAVNGITFATPVRITDAPGADYHAVPLQAGQSVAYLHRDGTGPSRLMMADANGANARSLGPEQAFEARYPRVLPDGQLAVA